MQNKPNFVLVFLVLLIAIICVMNIESDFKSLLPSAIPMILSVLTFLSLPQIQRCISPPKVVIAITGPTQDNQINYWHLKVKNSGGILKKASVNVVGFRCNFGPEEFIPPVRFSWPYEKADPTGVAFRDLVSKQYVDFFSTEQAGKLHTVVQTTKLRVPREGETLELGIQVIGEEYESKVSWFRITSTIGSFACASSDVQ